jgi:hypothetical protein
VYRKREGQRRHRHGGHEVMSLNLLAVVDFVELLVLLLLLIGLVSRNTSVVQAQ